MKAALLSINLKVFITKMTLRKLPPVSSNNQTVGTQPCRDLTILHRQNQHLRVGRPGGVWNQAPHLLVVADGRSHLAIWPGDTKHVSPGGIISLGTINKVRTYRLLN